MKRLYKEKELIGYDYDGVIIDIDYTDSNSYYNPWRRDGYLVKDLKPILGWCFFETLKEAKAYIDKYLK